MKLTNQFALILIMVFLLSSCNSVSKSDTQPDPIDPTEIPVSQEAESQEEVTEEVEAPHIVTPTFGGTLNIASLAPTTFDPLTNDIQSVQQVLGLIYEPLFILDEQLKPIPLLAESYSFEDNGRVLLIKIKKGIMFHNETELTANDVAYTITKIQSLEQSSYKKNVRPIQKATVVDSYTIKLYYNQGYAFALNDLIFPIVSKSYFQSSNYDPLKPIGSGPYQLLDYQKMQNFDLTAFLKWNGGSVYVENIHGIVVSAESDLETLFDQKLIDVMDPKRFNWLKYSENEDHKITGYTSSYYDFIGFNFNNLLFDDRALRQSFAYAINKEFILYDRFVNHGTLVNAPIIPTAWYATNKSLAYAYNIVKAKELLGTNYIDYDGDGFYDHVDESTQKTIELHMLISNENELRVSTAKLIQKDLEALGFKIILDLVDGVTFNERLINKDFDLVYAGWKLSLTPDFGPLFGTAGVQNIIDYSSEAMDRSLSNIVSATTDEELKSAVANFESHMIDNVPYISLYILDGAVMTQSNVYGEFTPNTESMYQNIKDIYLDF